MSILPTSSPKDPRWLGGQSVSTASCGLLLTSGLAKGPDAAHRVLTPGTLLPAPAPSPTQVSAHSSLHFASDHAQCFCPSTPPSRAPCLVTWEPAGSVLSRRGDGSCVVGQGTPNSDRDVPDRAALGRGLVKEPREGPGAVSVSWERAAGVLQVG